MLEDVFFSSKAPSQIFYDAASEDFYQHLKNLSGTIFSLQYNAVIHLSFRVQEVSFFTVLNPEPDLIVKCQIRGNTYTFTSKHFEQLSNREYQELLNQFQ